ncbi:MAG: hemolysin family protein [Pseudomonadota bacterium]
MPKNSKKTDYPSGTALLRKIKSWFKPKTPDLVHGALRNLQSKSKKMSEGEKHLLGNFLKFCNKTVEDVMIPRSDIFALSTKASLTDLTSAISKHSHTRTLIYQDNLDNIVGFIHIKDLFEVLSHNRSFSVKKLMRKVIVSAPSMKLIDLLAEMQKKRTHIAVVIDEYGGTDGIATIEDIMEAIVGEIEDEHDDMDENHSYVSLSSGEVLANARVEIEELEQALSITLRNEDDECDTIGGLVLLRTGHIPKKGEIIAISEKVSVEVMESTPRVLKKVKITLTQ